MSIPIEYISFYCSWCLCFVAAGKRHPVLHYTVVYSSGHLWSWSPFLGIPIFILLEHLERCLFWFLKHVLSPYTLRLAEYFDLLWIPSRKHACIILTPLNSILHSETGVYRGIHYFSYFAKNIDCGYLLEPPRRGGSYMYPQSLFWTEIRKISAFFLSETFPFWL